MRSATPVSIHGNRHVDLLIALEGDAARPVVGRVGRRRLPGIPRAGRARERALHLGVMVRVAREVG